MTCLECFHGGDALLGVKAQHLLQQINGSRRHHLVRILLLQEAPEASPGWWLLFDTAIPAYRCSAVNASCMLSCSLSAEKASGAVFHGAATAAASVPSACV